MGHFDHGLIDLRRRRLLQAGVAGTGILALPSLAGAATSGTKLKWGSASLGSTGYIIIEALAQTVQKNSRLACSTLATSGGAENMALIGRDHIDLGQTTSTDWPVAINGQKPFPAPVDARQIFAYTVWNIPLIVRQNADIHGYQDLAGKRVMPATAGGATAIMVKTLLQAAGVADQVHWNYGSWNDSYNAFKSGAVDAIPAVLTNGRPSPSLDQINATVPFRVLPIEAKVITQAQKINAGLLKSTVSHAQWEKAQGDMLMPAISGILAASPDLTDDLAYTVCKTIFEHTKSVHAVGSQLKDVGLKFATRYLLEQYPVNAGAARYFRERQVWDDDLRTATAVKS